MTTTASQTGNLATRSVDGVEVPIAGTYEIDAAHTDVGFVVRHLMLSKTRGRFPGVTGTIVIGNDSGARTAPMAKGCQPSDFAPTSTDSISRGARRHPPARRDGWSPYPDEGCRRRMPRRLPVAKWGLDPITKASRLWLIRA